MSNYSEGTLDLDKKNTTWTKIFGYVPDKAFVLDVGCSDGRLGRELKKHKKCVVYGIEIDKSDAAAAKRALDKVFDFNIETSPPPSELASQQFDVIILADVIEHFTDPVAALKKLRKFLRKDGRLIFSIPNMAHISVRLQLLAGEFDYTETGLLDRTHLHFYNFNEVVRVFTNAGLQIIENDANTLPYTPVFLGQKLAELGLSDDGFIKRVQEDIAAQAFQFVGYCHKMDKPINKIPLRTTTPEQELIDHFEELSRNHKALQEENTILKEETEKVGQQLKAITESLVWKVGGRVQKSINKLNPKRDSRG